MKTCPSCQAGYPTNFAVCPQDGTPLVQSGAWSDGTTIRGKYRILSKIGQGGMGAVYKALHISFDELRAIKVISPELVHDALFVKRFKHEAVITRKLQHPNAVRVDDIDEAEDGRPFIVMEYIEGQSLRKLIESQGALPVPRVCSIIRQVAGALDAAHRLGMIHRDIKPDNIVLVNTPEGEQAKVLDFGIAKIKEGRLGETAGMTLTGTGVVIGTPQYMSPEQAMGKRGDQLDGRSDLYSLGIVMYQMLTGDLPFRADTTMEMLLAHLQTPPVPIRSVRPELHIPDSIAALVMRLIEKKPAMRPPSAHALAAEVERAEAGLAAPQETVRMQPEAVYAPPAPEVRPSTPPVRRAVESPRPPTGVESPVPPPPVAERRPGPAPAPPAAKPVPQPRPARKPPTATKPSQWGIWVSLAILVLGLGGGTWYFTSRTPAPSQEPVTPVPSPSPPPGNSRARGTTTSSGQTDQSTSQPHKPEPPPERRAASEAFTRSSPAPAGGRSHISQPAPTVREPEPVREARPLEPVIDVRKVTAATKMGDFFFDRGEYDNAITEYQHGLEVDPGNRDLKGRIERARRAKAAEERLNQ